MKKVVLALIAVFLCGNLNAAENRYIRQKQPMQSKPLINEMESGLFLGAGLGYIGDALDYGASGQAFNNPTRSISDTLKGGGFDIGIVLSYKWAWEYLGVRAYGSLDYASIGLNSQLYEDKSYKAQIINFGVNIDALFRFYDFEKNFNAPVDIGAFIGLGLGYDRYQIENSMIGDIAGAFQAITMISNTTMQKSIVDNFNNNLAKDFFNVWLNVGLFTNLYKNHALELNFKVPFIKHKVLSLTTPGYSVNANNKIPFGFKFAYIYTF